jgi:LacI family transcriptional regulator
MKKRPFIAVLNGYSGCLGLNRGIRQRTVIKGGIPIAYPPPAYAQWQGYTFTNWIKALRPDGIILPVSCPELARILNLGPPCIIHRNLAKGPMPEIAERVPLVLGDGREMGRMAAEHLIGRGLRNFAYVGLKRSAHSRERRTGFTERLAADGRTAIVYEWPFARLRHLLKPGKGSFTEWLKKLPKPVGVMAITDVLGVLVIEACTLGGLHVPDEVAVIGVDNDEELCKTLTIPLSSVALNEPQIGAEALDLLCDIIVGRKKMTGQRLIIRPTHVAVRQSTSVVACRDENVKKALRFIEDHATESITAEQVVESTATNRTTLQRKFRELLGETMHQRIVNVKIRLISRMLLETDMPVYQIASATGFLSASNITNFFSKSTGMSPRAFREKHRPSETPHLPDRKARGRKKSVKS